MSRSCLGIDVGIRNLGFCVLQRDEKDKSFLIKDWQLVDVMERCGISNSSCKKLTSGQIHDMAAFILPVIFPTEFVKLHRLSHVSIEQQPHGKYGNQKIILFSHLLYDYFRRLLHNQVWGDTLETVVFTGAGQKYKPTWLALHNLPIPKTYPQRKLTSEKLCEAFCRVLKLMDLPDGPKRDDRADALLLALVIWERW
jgi:hypothetical protein